MPRLVVSAPIEAAAGLQFVFEIRAVDQLHRIEDHAVLLAEAVEPNDIRMLQLLERFDFDFEPLAKTLFDGQMRIENLDRRRLAGFDIQALEDGPHAAAAKPPAKTIGSELFQLHQSNVTWGRGEGLGARG